MSKLNLMVPVLFAASCWTPFASTANATEPVSRADVKAATRAAEKNRTLTPAGEGPEFPVPATSEKSREQRKAETLSARKAGQLQPTGVAGDFRADNAVRAQGTTVNRAERKAETRAAEKAGKLVPAGQGPGVSR